VFDALHAAIDELATTDLDGVPATVLNEMVVELQRVRAKLDAAEARVVARWDAESCWSIDGARSGAAWLGWRCHLPTPV
jgi:hypothetical protein